MNNQANLVWIPYDSDSEYSNNVKEHFKNFGLKGRFDFMPLNNYSNKNEQELRDEIMTKIREEVKCAILLPSTSTNHIAISIVYAQKKLFNNQNLPRKQQIQFLVNTTLHNDETLKREGSAVEEGLIVVVPIPQLDQPIRKSLNDL